MHVFHVHSYNQFVWEALRTILDQGSEVSPRGMRTTELLNVALELDDPRNRTITLPGRRANIFATIAEVLWVLAGRDDLDFVKFYLPRYADYSDDGSTLHGAYGRRFRNWYGTDQLSEVMQILRQDADSRRAVVTLFDPGRDFQQESKDIPCNVALHFVVRNGHLHLTVYQRSQDVIWGGTIDVFLWTVLQELVAGWLDIKLGLYTHFIGSLHLYSRFYERARQMVHTSVPENALPRIPIKVPEMAFEQILAACFDQEQRMRTLQMPPSLDRVPAGWFREALRMLWSYHLYKFGKIEEATEYMLAVPYSDLQQAGLLYYQRSGR